MMQGLGLVRASGFIVSPTWVFGICFSLPLTTPVLPKKKITASIWAIILKVQRSVIGLGIGMFLGLISYIWGHISFFAPPESVLC